MRIVSALGFLLALQSLPALAVEDGFRVREVKTLAGQDVARQEPKTILLTDPRGDPLAEAETGLIKFEDWARSRPVEKRFLALYPAYEEQTVKTTIHGVARTRLEKLSMYVVEARFVLDRPPGQLNLARYATPSFVERVDPAIKHRVIAGDEIVPVKDLEAPQTRNPERLWCPPGGPAICLQSRYLLEGKLPMGVRLANKLDEGSKKVAEYLDFQSELRLVPAADLDQAALARLTGVGTPIAGALEQTIFFVNQIMRFGKFMAVFQDYPGDANRTVVTAFVALAVKSDVLDRKKEYERVPVLRNLVPAQVLMGKSSFNTGSSLSAGLPDYTRNQLKAVAALLQRD